MANKAGAATMSSTSAMATEAGAEARDTIREGATHFLFIPSSLLELIQARLAVIPIICNV